MADTPLLVVFPRGQLTPDDKAQMREVGIIAVEADDPKAVAQLHLTQPLVTSNISGDAVVLAALGALCSQPTEDNTGHITSVGRAMVKFTEAYRAALERAAASGMKAGGGSDDR